jgi:hypothetical protein
MPLKSASFYGDSQINTFLGSSFSNTFENDNLVKDQTYGFLASTSISKEFSNYFSITLRGILFKFYNFIIYYFFNWYSFLNSKIFLNFYYLVSYLYFKLDFIFNIIKLTSSFYININYTTYIYLVKFIIFLLKFFISFFGNILFFY